MVTTHKIYESRMGNRVSKSDGVNTFVKEQRVDGNCCSIFQNMQLRYTLTAYENRYQTEILSNPSHSNESILDSVNTIDSKPFYPWLITVYFGCGSVYINCDIASFNVYGFAFFKRTNYSFSLNIQYKELKKINLIYGCC